MAKAIVVTDIVDVSDVDYAVIEAAFGASKAKAKVATALKARLKGLDVEAAGDAYKAILAKVRGKTEYKLLDATRKGVYDCLKSAMSTMRAKAKKAKASKDDKTGATQKWVEQQIAVLESMVVTLQGDKLEELGVKDAPKAVAAANAAIAAFKAAMM